MNVEGNVETSALPTYLVVRNGLRKKTYIFLFFFLYVASIEHGNHHLTQHLSPSMYTYNTTVN